MVKTVSSGIVNDILLLRFHTETPRDPRLAYASYKTIREVDLNCDVNLDV